MTLLYSVFSIIKTTKHMYAYLIFCIALYLGHPLSYYCFVNAGLSAFPLRLLASPVWKAVFGGPRDRMEVDGFQDTTVMAV